MIKTKGQNYRLCNAGEYGNRMRQWSSVDEWVASGYADPVALRVSMEKPGGPKEFNVSPADVDSVIRKWECEHGVRRDQVRVAEMANGPRILQGKYANDFTGELLYTLGSGPLPTALEQWHSYAFGLRSDLLIRNTMTTASYEDWTELLLRYPRHVFEFSVWDSCVGDTLGRNAIVWEVRTY